ncbi:MAG: InlB B-repeat-containing protein [Bacteroidaceae bacterium]|nr:InlB B-repeat-containing protein [Bacteroidaceae bacterium]
MKKYILSIIAIALSMMSAFAQTISVEDVTIKAGETKVVSINLNNTQTNIVSFQMDLTLTDGITINKAGCTLGSRIVDTDQELTIGKQPDGSIRLTSTSFALSPIAGTSGEIVKLSLTAAKDANGGAASVKNIVLATSNSEKLKPANASFKVKVSYILTYKVDGNVYKTVPVEYGAAITSEAAPTKEGHTFSGWSNLPATMPNHNVEVTGTFTINSYTLTYKVDGNVYKTSTVPYGSTITPEAAPTKEGYTFSGWSEIPKTMPAKDVTVTGSFTINKYKLTYMVDGEVYKTYTIAYGTTLTPEAEPTKEGYTFSGWSEIPVTMPDHDVVVIGFFSKGQYVLTYIVDGQTYKSIRMDYGNTIIPEAAPTKEGYTFSGWSEIPKTMPAKDVVVTGSFTINKYKLTYKIDGVEYKSYEINFGTAITPEATPTKEGYTFSGWSGIPKTMPAKDVVVTGSYTINKYKLTYMVDGEVYKTFTLAYGTAITPEASPTKEGYTFSGWSEIPATMPAHDVVVTGFFSKGQYVLTYIVDGQTYKSIRMDYGNTIIPEAAPTKEGYTFSGWSEIPKTMPAKDVVVTGSFTINKYKLTYMVDGVVYKTYEINYASAITPEEEPAKEGYTFSGWSEIPATMPAHDVTVTGSFSTNHEPYAVLSENNTILTFYYDDQMESRGGMNLLYGSQWNGHRGEITTVVFDESFAVCMTLTSISNWFSGCSKLKSIVGLENLRTDNVIDMRELFRGCSGLTSLDVSSFRTDNVTDMGGMFSGCSSLKSLDVSSFRTDNVTDMSSMFYGCGILRRIFVGAEWTTNNVTSGDNMFNRCFKLVGGAGTRYDSNHTDYTYAHIDDGIANPGYFRDKSLPNLEPYAVLSENNTVLTFYYDDQMESRGGVDVYDEQWDGHADDITTVVFDESFAGCTTLTSTRAWFIGCSKLKSIMGMNYLKTDKVMDMGLMFYGCSSLTSLDLSSFKTDNVTDMGQMFYGCSSLKKIYVDSGWTTVNVKYGDYMFGGCTKLIGGAGTRYSRYDYNNNHASYAHIDGGPSNPGFFRDRNMPDFDPYILLSDDNTVLTFYCDDQMEIRQGLDVYDQPWSSLSADIITVVFDESFAYCTTLTSTATWFKDFSKLSNIVGLDNLRTDNVTDMGYMFYGCSCLTSLNLSSFKTDNVKFIPYMFENCENLTTIYVREGWTTSNVGMSVNMFSNCPKLVGGEGTTYDSNHTAADYAHIDGGVTNPGYLTYKETHNTITYMVDGEEYKSYRIENGKDITPEPKPIKDGYVFLGWNDIPATMPDHDVVVTGAFYPYGDVNVDKKVNVVDVVDIARFVVGTPSDSFVKVLADLNNDGSVNLGDAVVLINDIAGDQNFVKALVTPEITGNDMLTLKYNNGNFSLCLNNEHKYTAFQCDIYIPENADVSKIKLNTQHNQKHQLLYNKVEEGHYRVAVLSTSNNEFNDNEGELLNIIMNGVSDDEVSVRDIHFFDVKGIDYLFDDIEGSNTTSLTPSFSEGEGDVIYDLQGRKHSTLKRGVNIVGGNKVIVK